MAGSSNLDYLYASNANVSNFVSVKLSGNHNFPLWKTQMLCLMESHDMRGIVDADSAFDGLRTSSIKKKYDSLLKGWIFGSITEDVLVNVFNLDSAKDVWEKLNSMYNNPTFSFQIDSAQTHPEAKEETNDKDVVSEEIETETKGEISKTEERERMEGKKKLGNGIPEKHKDVGREELNSETKDHHYLYASIANVCNFVSVKLSGNHNYPLWKRQMLCLMESHDMLGIVDADSAFDGPRTSSIKKKYDSLLTGWIFGSITEDVLINVFNLESAKDVWEKLNSIYQNPTIRFQQDSSQTKPEAKKETKDIGEVSAETETKTEKEKEKEKEKERMERKKKLRKATMEGYWPEVRDILEKHKDAGTEELNSDGNTVLHLAVGIGHNDFVSNLLGVLEMKVVEKKNNNGSTALHIAAIVGNLQAAQLLVRKNNNLLTILDKEDEEPVLKAYYNMQFDTFVYLSWVAIDHIDETFEAATRQAFIKKGIDFLVNVILEKKYSTALQLIQWNPEVAVENDDVLVALAKTFPSGLTNEEKLFYPSLDEMRERIIHRTRSLFMPLAALWVECREIDDFEDIVESIPWMLLFVPVLMLALVYLLIRYLMLVVYLPFFLLYFLSWKVARILVTPIKHIEKKKKEWEDAKKILELVCDLIEEEELGSGTHHFNYDRSILEAACQNAYQVVDEILVRSPEAIMSRDKNGHDVIQLAVIHGSEKIYNLIHQIGERKCLYRKLEDNYGNNILHLAGRLAPSHELNRRTGAALQLQRELQWREEVKKLVLPTFLTKENIFKETPDMVFTREHEKLMKEGEKWMRTTSESCSITAALITTIVFAAAITVPGGSNQETGVPLLTEDIAFTIFAISDAISLFTSSTSLLVFLSILTARFAEQDFLFRLPRRMIIGLCALLLSAIAMMVAFSATLFLVFCRQKPWMLAPICGLAFLPIAFFVTIQFPLIVDLCGSTYRRTFGKESISHQYRWAKKKK